MSSPSQPAISPEAARDPFIRRVALIAAGGLVLRMVWIVAERHSFPITDGTGFYFGLAKALSHGKGFIDPHEYLRNGGSLPSANHTPAWPLLLTLPQLVGLHSLLASQVFAGFIGTVTVVATGYAGRAVAGPRVGVIAAGIAALYPSFWLYERELMSETLALLLIALTVLVAYGYRGRATASRSTMLGVLCGLLALTHPDYLLLLPLLCGPLILGIPSTSWRRRVGLLAVACVAAGAFVLPWVTYNARRFDRPVFMTTAFGLTLVDSNCNYTYYGPRLGSWGVLCSLPIPKLHDIAAVDARMEARASKYVGRHLGRLPVVLAAREGRTWGLFRPLQQTHFDSSIGSALSVERLRLAIYWMLAPTAIIGAFVLRRRRIPLAPLGALFILVATTVALSFGDTRYRTPAEVAIVLLAAVAIDAALTWVRPEPHPRPARLPAE